jgi:DNA-binding response OmpR family regulator
MRRLIRGVPQRDGFEVVEAGDGLGVLEELRAQVRTACLPVIVLTAQHGETEEKALDLGAHDYLSKPVQTRSLLARVRAVLKRASS